MWMALATLPPIREAIARGVVLDALGRIVPGAFSPRDIDRGSHDSASRASKTRETDYGADGTQLWYFGLHEQKRITNRKSLRTAKRAQPIGPFPVHQDREVLQDEQRSAKACIGQRAGGELDTKSAPTSLVVGAGSGR